MSKLNVEAPRKKTLAKAVARSMRKWRRQLGLPNWEMYYSEQTAEEMPDWYAEITTTACKNEITIKYADNLLLESVDWVICHELIHWLLFRAEVYAKRFITSKRDRAYFEDLMEEVVEALAIALVQPPRPLPAHFLISKDGHESPTSKLQAL